MSKSSTYLSPYYTTVIVIIISLLAVMLSGCTDSALPSGHPPIEAQTNGATSMQNTSADFDAAMRSGKPVVVYFNEAWCSKCKDQGPIIESINTAVGGSAVVVVLDRSKNPQVASKYNITVAPNMLIFDGDGNVIRTGYANITKLADAIDSNKP